MGFSWIKQTAARHRARSLDDQLVLEAAGLLVIEVLLFVVDFKASWLVAALVGVLIPLALVMIIWTQTDSWGTNRRAALLLFTLGLGIYLFGSATIYQAANHKVHRGFAPQLHHYVDALYFTLSTFTTAGFGDIHAAAPTCRRLVSGQMFIDVSAIALGLAFFISRLSRDEQPRAARPFGRQSPSRGLRSVSHIAGCRHRVDQAPDAVDRHHRRMDIRSATDLAVSPG